MALTDEVRYETLQRIAYALETLMPPGADMRPHPGSRLHVDMHVTGAPNRLGREISIRLGDAALQRYLEMDDARRGQTDDELCDAVRIRMQAYDDGRGEVQGTVFEPFVIDLSDMV